MKGYGSRSAMMLLVGAARSQLWEKAREKPMRITRTCIFLLVAGLSNCATSGGDEPIQPVFVQNMRELDVWKGQWNFHRGADGELVLIGRGGPEGTAIASGDGGRTWHDWPDVRNWPNVGISAVARRGNELFVHGPDAPDLRVYRSEDNGRNWNSGYRLMQWPKLVAIPNGPRANHPDEGFRGKALLWSTPGDRIVVTREGHLVLSIMVLLGGEGVGPELIGTMISEDSGATWRVYELFGPPQGFPDRPTGFTEPKPIELSDGRMWLVFRTCLGHLWQAYSTDGGRTWGEPTSTGLDSPLAPLHAQRVPNDDAVVVVFDHSKPGKDNPFRPRTPMVFVVSHDHCQTWSRPVIVTNDIGYMRNIYFSDKEMFILYEEKPGTDESAPGRYYPKLVVYDLKTVLSLQAQ